MLTYNTMINGLLLYTDLVGIRSRIMRSNWIFVSECPKINIKKDIDLEWALWSVEILNGKSVSTGILHFRRTVAQGRIYKIIENIIKLSTIIDYEVALSFFNNEETKKNQVFKYGKVPDFTRMPLKSTMSLAFQTKPSTTESDDYKKAKCEILVLLDIIENQKITEDELWMLFPNLMTKYWRFAVIMLKKKKRIRLG